MENKIRTWPGLIRNRWFRLGTSIVLAFVLLAMAIFGPTLTSSKLHMSLPILPYGQTFDLSFPFNVELAHATNGLTITKFATPPNFVDQGGLLTYTLIVTNGTNTALDELLVTDTVPLQTSCAVADGGGIVNSVDSSGSTWIGLGFQPDCDAGTAKWFYSSFINGGDQFNPGETVHLSYTVRITTPLRDWVDKIVNNADYQVTTNPALFTDTGQITVTNLINAPLWNITKSAIPDPVEPGATLTYTIAVTNIGHLITTGSYTIVDTLPANTNYITSTPPATFSSGDLTWVFTPTVGINQGFTVTYVVTVTEPLTNNISIVNQTYSITGGSVFSHVFGVPLTVTVDSPVTMTIAKTDGPDPVQAGALLNYTITLTNHVSSKGPAQSIIFSDTLPANTVFNSAGVMGGNTANITNPGVNNPGVVTWNITAPNPLPIGQSVALTLAVRALSPLPNNSILTNTTYNVAVSNTLVAVQGITPVTTTVASAPIITFSKTVVPNPVFTNQPVTYTIIVTNTGNETALNVPFTDTLPAGFSPSNITWNLTITGRDIFNNPGQASHTFNTTAPSIDGIYPNFLTATVGATNLSIGPVATVTVFTPVNLQLTKQRVNGSGSVIAGNPITYTLTITNLGPATTGAIVTDTFTPGAAALVTYTHNLGGALCAGVGTIVCNLTSFTGTGIITVTLNTLSTFSNTLTNTAIIMPNQSGVIDFNLSDNTGTVTHTVRLPQTDLQISKQRIGSGSVIAGNPITYTIIITNATGSDSVNTVVTDTLLSSPLGGVSSVISSTSIAATCSGLTTVACRFTNFTNTAVITLAVNTSGAFSGTITNSAVITGDNVTVVEVFTPNNTSANVTTTVRLPQTDLQISKQRIGSGSVIAGNPITYTIIITNATGSDSVNTVVTDTLLSSPLGGISSVISSTSIAATCSGLTTMACRFTNFTNTAVITLVVNTLGAFSGTITNSAVITGDNVTVVEVFTPNNTSANVTTTVRLPQADLQISKQRVGGSGTVVAGNPITYAIIITNATGSESVNAVVTDTLLSSPLGGVSSVISSTSIAAACSGLTTVACHFTNFTNTAVITLVVNTAGTFSGTITNSAVITGDNVAVIEVFTPNNSSNNVVTTVRFPQTDLQIDKVRNGTGDVVAGNLITYTITITNSGGNSANIVVTDTFTATEATFDSCSGGCTNLGGGVVTWTVGAFTNTQSFTVALRSLQTFSGTLANNVAITQSVGTVIIDLNNLNNTNSATTSVRYPTADLQISKVRNGAGTVIAGSLITYTITITNTGPDTVNIVVTDTFTATEATLDSCSGGCANLGGGVVTWTVGAFTNTQSFTVVLRSLQTFSGTLVNNVAITQTTTLAVDPDNTNNTSSVSVTIALREADLQVNKQRIGGSGDVISGDFITYTITITNAGPDTANVILTDTFTGGINTIVSAVTSPGLCDTITGVGGVGPLVCQRAGFTGTGVITVVIDTLSAFSGTLSNNVVITLTEINVVDTNINNNTSSVVSTVRPRQADLQITKVRVGSGIVNPGDLITFTVIITNAGPDPVPATFVDFVNSPAAVSGLSASMPGWTCTINTASMSCGTSSFTNSQTINIVMTASAIFSGSAINNASINPTAVELNSSDNSDSVSFSIIQIGTSALTITKSANPASGNTVASGSAINYTIAVTNNGSAAATNVIITDVLPSGVGFVSCSSSNGNCIGGSTTVITSAGLGAGQSLTATVQVTVTAAVSGTVLTNTAILNSDQQAVISNSNIVSHQVITSAGTSIYLPIIMKNFVGCADLQITGLQALAGGVISVTVTNAGACATDSNFWVDIYANIQGQQPTALVGATADRRWKSSAVNATYGLGWEVPVLGANASQILTTDGSTGLGPTSPDQNWPPATGTSVIAYADSFDSNDPDNATYVEIREADETNNQSLISVITLAGFGLEQSSPPLSTPSLSRQDLR